MRIAASTNTSQPRRIGISSPAHLVGATRLCGYVARARQAGTPGAELHPAIAALHVEHHFKKGQYSPSYSGFEGYEDNTDSIPSREQVASDMATGRTLAVALESTGIECVDVVGLAESHCVKETALDARKLGLEVHVIENLTEPVSEELGIAARRQMLSAGVILD